MSIGTMIKQAMLDAGLKPAGETEKKATGNKLADDLYAIANSLEKLGNARVGGGASKAAGAETHSSASLRGLAKAYLFQRMLKSAVEDRLGIASLETEKSATGLPDIRIEYLKAFEKTSMEKAAIGPWSMNALKRIPGAVADAIGGAGKAVGSSLRNSYVAGGLGLAAGIPAGGWMGKNIGAHNLALNQMPPDERKAYNRMDRDYYNAVREWDKEKLIDIDKLVARHAEKAKALRRQM